MNGSKSMLKLAAAALSKGLQESPLKSGLAEKGNFCRTVFLTRRYSAECSGKETNPTSKKSDSGEIDVEIPVKFDLHLLESGPSQVTTTNKEELMKIYTDMQIIRRAEIAADMLFKSQMIRGFCHLYDGQEAVSVGLERALSYDDNVITAYRDHGIFLGRGGTVFELFSELMGKRTGCALGKGGSMHLYHREHNFWGGWGIVGTTPPLGAGLAFGQKYEKKPNVTAAIYGDGAGNQVSSF